MECWGSVRPAVTGSLDSCSRPAYSLGTRRWRRSAAACGATPGASVGRWVAGLTCRTLHGSLARLAGRFTVFAVALRTLHQSSVVGRGKAFHCVLFAGWHLLCFRGTPTTDNCHGMLCPYTSQCGSMTTSFQNQALIGVVGSLLTQGFTSSCVRPYTRGMMAASSTRIRSACPYSFIRSP